MQPWHLVVLANIVVSEHITETLDLDRKFFKSYPRILISNSCSKQIPFLIQLACLCLHLHYCGEREIDELTGGLLDGRKASVEGDPTSFLPSDDAVVNIS